MAASHLVRAALVLASVATLNQTASAQVAGTDPAEEAIFRTVVGEVARTAEGVFLADPRVLQPGANLTSIEPEEVGAVADDRASVLRQMGIETTAFLSDQPCLFAAGSPPVPEVDPTTAEQHAVRQRCRERTPFTSAIFGRPLPASSGDGDTKILIVARMTTSSYSVHEYVLQCGPDGWRIVRTEKRVGVQS